LHIGNEGIQPAVVEAQAVDECVGRGQAEHAGLGVAGLGQWRDGADFHKAKAHGAQAVDTAGVFVQASSHAHAVGKRQPRQGDGIVHLAVAVGQLEWVALAGRQAGHGDVVGDFGVQIEQNAAGEGVGHQRHRIIPAFSFQLPGLSPMTTPASPAVLSQDELKTLVGQAALQYVVPGEIVGVGTGSTVNKFIDALATIKDQIKGAVSSSVASTERLQALGIKVFDSNEVDKLSVYIDGADEIDGAGNMVKGGGAALTREKIVAAQSAKFVCIADESKLVKTLGQFPLPVEVIPMATQRVIAQFAAKGGVGTVRQKDGKPLVTDNGQWIVDVTGLQITDPLAFETEVSQWPGVVTVGVFAFQRAQVCLLGTATGVKTLTF
jgi:ribose 5-phosphate isomerase A